MIQHCSEAKTNFMKNNTERITKQAPKSNSDTFSLDQYLYL